QVSMKTLQVWLVCEEEATFTQGTDTRTEVRQAYRRLCFERSDFQIEPAIPFTAPCSVALPADAMHSFQSPHNAVRWKIVVIGEADKWPAFERGFPLVAYPGQATMQINTASFLARSALMIPPPAAAGVRA